MYAQKEKPKDNKSRAVVNSVGQQKANRKQSFGFVDNRPESEVQKSLQRMKIRTVDKASEVIAATHNKHVMGIEGQAADAKAGYGPRTYITSDAILTNIVDANPHNFTDGNGVKSARKLITEDVAIYQYEKDEDPPAGWAKDKPVTRTVNGESKPCEIGVTKGGDEKLKIDHFRYII